MIRYSLDSKGRVQVIGLRGHIAGEYELTNEPFRMSDAFNWRKDLTTNEWIFDPIVNIPMEITKYQLLKELLKRDLYDSLINELESSPNRESKILFEASNLIHIESDVAKSIREALKMTTEEFNKLYIASKKTNNEEI